tara:strand:+ start:1054 stop:1341 length:288 start_codon:yes stop_codon:yes gene_type:complete
MIRVSVHSFYRDESYYHTIIMGGNKEPSLEITVCDNVYEETMKTIVNNILDKRTFIWEQEKIECECDEDKDADLDIKDKIKILSLQKEIEKGTKH